jgi:hypothetical protein
MNRHTGLDNYGRSEDFHRLKKMIAEERKSRIYVRTVITEKTIDVDNKRRKMIDFISRYAICGRYRKSSASYLVEDDLLSYGA